MTFKDLVYEYGRDGSTEVMEKLTSKVDKFVEEVREMHPDMVEKFLTKIDLLLNPYFTRKTAEYVVKKLENKDGTIGGHWSYEQTTSVMPAGLHEADWHYVINMIYSDYYKSGRSDETYIGLAKDFMDDTDAPRCKAKKYYLAMTD